LSTVYVPRTDNHDDRPAQIANDLIVRAVIYRNGGSSHDSEIHLCAECLRIGVRALKNELSKALDEYDSGHDLQVELATLTKRLARTQHALSSLAHDHNRMQDRLRDVLAKLPVAEVADREIEFAQWEVSRGRAPDYMSQMVARYAAMETAAAALPQTADGHPIYPGLRAWRHIDGDDYYHGVEDRDGWAQGTVRGITKHRLASNFIIWWQQDENDDTDECFPGELYLNSPETNELCGEEPSK
jgi:hypothetical protein